AQDGRPAHRADDHCRPLAEAEDDVDAAVGQYTLGDLLGRTHPVRVDPGPEPRGRHQLADHGKSLRHQKYRAILMSATTLLTADMPTTTIAGILKRENAGSVSASGNSGRK